MGFCPLTYFRIPLLIAYSEQFPDPGPWKHPQPRPLELAAPLGLDALPTQRFAKVKRTSFGLNLMVVGKGFEECAELAAPLPHFGVSI